MSKSVSQIHIQEIALLRVDATAGLFLCYLEQGRPCEGRGQESLLLVGLKVVKDIGIL